MESDLIYEYTSYMGMVRQIPCVAIWMRTLHTCLSFVDTALQLAGSGKAQPCI